MLAGSGTRDRIATTIRRLLLGPLEERERLRLPRIPPIDPTDVYLTGILWPQQLTLSPEEDDAATPAGGDKDDGDAAPEASVPLFSIRKPASLGLSCSIAGSGTPFGVILRGATYDPPPDEPPTAETSRPGSTEVWERHPFEYQLRVSANERRASWREKHLTRADGSPLHGLELHVVRRVREQTVIVTVSLVNTHGRGDAAKGRNCFYQTGLELVSGTDGNGFILARAEPARFGDDDADSGRLLFRGREEFAVGHGVAASWDTPRKNRVHRVWTEWLPHQIVKPMSREGHPKLRDLPGGTTPAFAASRLGHPGSRDTTLSTLRELTRLYQNWISDRENQIQSLPPDLVGAARRHLDVCRDAHRRMAEGIAVLETDPRAFRAFCLANQAMQSQSVAPSKGKAARPLVWYPFQIAFLLLSIPSAVDESHPDRSVLDLLWFPTGGGKTEAYLGLSAFTIFMRRLREQVGTPHVDVLMRYTLRLLTVQQFQRAAAMICAAELIRRDNPGELGSTPISIGLYVGEAATPNRLEKARALLDEEASGGRPRSTPRLLLACPLCGSPLTPAEYRISGTPPRMDVACISRGCPSTGNPLQVFTVDEDIYRERPSLLIATIDKFAQLPRKEEVGLLFGRPEGLPPALIIQDELHLISGPLGTIAGLYETCIDMLCDRKGTITKVIGSTATIGRASSQVRALFDRNLLQFPPPGLDADDSFFAVRDDHAPDRLYMGLSSTGRSPKFALQAAVAAALMATEAARVAGVPLADIDPFWTTLLYFNSLRELGGATVLVRDDVARQTRFFAGRLGIPDRAVAGEPTEITSRVPSTQIPRILKDLERSLLEDPARGEPVDVALASSMISVGVDVPRLGLMIVNGQPKATAEYIQATSRVGRGVPGLVLTVFNHGRPRDISHFEHFVHVHQTLYRRVEVTSVTPWSSRARDRALHAVFAASARHLDAQLRDRFAAGSFSATNSVVPVVRNRILGRVASAGGARVDLQVVAAELDAIVQRWAHRANTARAAAQNLEYWATLRPFDNAPTNPHLMRAAEDPDANRDPWVWATPNSMREVEPSAYYVCYGSQPVDEKVDPAVRTEASDSQSEMLKVRPRSARKVGARRQTSRKS